MCCWCRAHKRARREHQQEHDIEYLAASLAACHDSQSCCAISGRSLLALHKVGERLTVDRVNPRRGYVPGNIHLIAGSLNEAKREMHRVPGSALNALLRKLEFVTDDVLTDESAAAREF